MPGHIPALGKPGHEIGVPDELFNHLKVIGAAAVIACALGKRSAGNKRRKRRAA